MAKQKPAAATDPTEPPPDAPPPPDGVEPPPPADVPAAPPTAPAPLELAIVHCARGHKGLLSAELVTPGRCVVNGCGARAWVMG